MKRWLLNLVSVLSILLCIGTGALWLRSCTEKDRVYFFGQHQAYGLETGSGVLTLILRERQLFDDAGWRHEVWPEEVNRSELWHNGSLAAHLGFGVSTQRRIGGDMGDYGHFATLPLWFLMLCFAVAPAVRILQLYRKRKARRLGLCEECGYDLRATPGRCPECGHEAAGAKA